MPVVTDRHRLVLTLFVAALTGCPPPTTRRGRRRRSRRSRPRRNSVSLASLTIGGDFDGAGDQEVQVIVKANQESRRLVGTRELGLPDAALRTFDFGRDPRLWDSPDDSSRALTAELFAPALECKAPANGAEADSLHDTLRRGLERAKEKAEASTHTYVRAAVPRLTATAEELLRALGRAVGPSAKALHEQLAELRDALGKVTPAERGGREKLYADVQALVDAGPPAFEAQQLLAAVATVTAAKAALEAPTASEPTGELHLEVVLGGYLSLLERAQSSAQALPAVGPLLTAFQAAIRSELGAN